MGAGFDQIKNNLESAKSLSQYGLEKFGITVIKQSNAFASKVNRFHGAANSANKHSTPGPGQYTQEQQWVKVKSLGTKQDWQAVAFNKITNPPSIPSHDFVFGYEED